MKEDFIHYVWKYKKFEFTKLKTTTGELIILSNVGSHNTHCPGLDFFNAQLSIEGQKWAGNVELHIKTSDWYVHRHELDPLYDNVILHVVWEDDTVVFRKDKTLIPTLQLKDYVDTALITQYETLFLQEKNSGVYCEEKIKTIPTLVLTHWKDRLYLERLEQKTIVIQELVTHFKGDWEAVLFAMLAKNFGSKVNGDAFLSMAMAMDFSTVRKCSTVTTTLEALFFGQTKLIESDPSSTYARTLQKEYAFLQHKFGFINTGILPVHFFRLRPVNFPTIRLSQLAMLYVQEPHLFSKIINLKHVHEFEEVFNVKTSVFWETHYTFNKVSNKRKKCLSKAFINLLIINVIIPLKFVYAKSMGMSVEDELVALIEALPKEQNSIIDTFVSLKVPIESALDSQALLQMKTQYCNQHRCLQCELGNHYLKHKL